MSHNQAISDRAKASFCSSRGNGRYTTDWIPQMKVNKTVHTKTLIERKEIKRRKNGE